MQSQSDPISPSVITSDLDFLEPDADTPVDSDWAMPELSLDSNDPNHLNHRENSQQYFASEPDVHGDVVVFVSDDQLWRVAIGGGVAVALGGDTGEKRRPRISPDGTTVAYTSNEEGSMEVWVVPIDGGASKRITYAGYALVVDWTPDGNYIVFQGFKGFHGGNEPELFRVPITGGMHQSMNVGWSHYLAFAPLSQSHRSQNRSMIIGRFTADVALWKRYQGGQKGIVFLDPSGDGQYRIMLEINGAIGMFVWVGSRMFFVSDYHCHPSHDGYLDKEMEAADGVTCSSQIFSVLVHTAPGDERVEVEQRIQSITQHTSWGKFKASQKHNHYIRNIQSDGSRIVFQKGADVYWLDITDNSVYLVPIQTISEKPQLGEYSLPFESEIQNYDISPDGKTVVYVARGRPFLQSIISDSPMIQFGKRDGYTRYRLCTVLGHIKTPTTVSSIDGSYTLCAESRLLLDDSDRLVLFRKITTRLGSNAGNGGQVLDPSENIVVAGQIGRIKHLVAAPTEPVVAVVNHLHQLLVVNVVTRAVSPVDSAPEAISDLAWSPDSQFLAYTYNNEQEVSRVKILHVPSLTSFFATNGILHDHSPAWDPSGRYLYFLSDRDLVEGSDVDDVVKKPVFVETSKPFLILLSPELNNPPPFLRRSVNCEGMSARACREGAFNFDVSHERDLDQMGRYVPKPDPANKGTNYWLQIPDWQHPHVQNEFASGSRIVPFPLKRGNYQDLVPLPNGIGYRRPAREGTWDASRSAFAFDFDAQTELLLAQSVSHLESTESGKMLIVGFYNQPTLFCVFLSSARFPLMPASGMCPQLQNEQIRVKPLAEWTQILLEAWRYQRDNFWTRSMNGLKWKYHRSMYLSLINRLGSRSQLTDVVNVMQGDLGTSHAFYRSIERTGCPVVPYKLGADLEWNSEVNGYTIVKKLRGDVWSTQTGGPLSRVGVNVNEGDVITRINGKEMKENENPHLALIGASSVRLTVVKPKSLQKIEVSVDLLRTDMATRYRDWVESNRRYVHEHSNNRVGYIHVPDMTQDGWIEFHRYITIESTRDALILDFRYNGGGYISDGLLDIISRKTMHLELLPNSAPSRFPALSIPGPHVILINEGCASDCEIFSQNVCSRMRVEGGENSCVRIGTRTWGGVIGIDYKGHLVDGTTTTQPEYAFWFFGEFPGDKSHKHGGWGVENFGVTPDLYVYTRPHDYANNKDPQLDQGIEYALTHMSANPSHFVLKTKTPPPCKDPLWEFNQN
eukprot:c9112_g1_i2.p1 GENE.c9112_g1_i2~~c9112_g1_i2.p1  ORF type:complete len:1244 (-),score=334.21 c9112_g1_i2:359-4090(-)